MANNHGGKRAGAGRKARPDLLTYSVKLTAAQAALLKMWGGGNASAGLRWLIDMASRVVKKIEKMSEGGCN